MSASKNSPGQSSNSATDTANINTVAPRLPNQNDVPNATGRVHDQPAATTGPVTPSIPTTQPADTNLGKAGDNEDERLDEALQETMPTSDPVSIKIA